MSSVRPVHHSPGLLDRRYLGPSETPLLELRPNFIGYALGPVIGAGVLGVLTAVLAGDATQVNGPPDWIDASLLGALVAVGLSAYSIFRWLYVCYAVTSKRLVEKSGILTRTILDIPHGAVQSVAFTESALGRTFHYGTLQFSSASVAGFALNRIASRPGVLNWIACPQPMVTRSFYESVRDENSGSQKRP